MIKSGIEKVCHHYWPRLRSRFVNALSPRNYVYSRGLKFSLGCDNWVTHYRWRRFNEREPKTLDWIDNEVKDGGVFFDVGANIGVFSIYAALRHPRLKVIAFEPEYSNLHLLRDNVIANHLEDRISIYSVALSDLSGVSYLHIQDFTPGAALHRVSKQNIQSTNRGKPVVLKEGIATVTLDQFCRDTGLEPNDIKVDVDGTEFEVLRGGLNIWKSPSFNSLMIEMEFARDETVEKKCRDLLSGSGLQWLPQKGTDIIELWARKD